MRRALVAVTLLFAVALGGAYASGAFGGSVKSDLRLAKHAHCRGPKTRLVGPKVVKRFRAVTAVLCTEGLRTYPGQGQWEVGIRKVAISGVPAWQRYFEQPSEPNVPKNGACTAVLIVIAVPTFVDGRGHSLVPRTPIDRCHHPLGWPHRGRFPRVRWHVVSVHRIKQIVSAPAVAANCPMRMGNTVAWAGPPRDAKAGTPLFDRTPKRFHVCVYRTRPDNFATGYFVRGFRLGAARTRQLLAALDGPGPKRGCPKQRTFAAINANRSIGATVELGGCYRVATALGARTANPPVVRRILGGG